MIPRVPQVKSWQSDNMPKKTTHDINPRYDEILEMNETNYKRRIFLKSLHSNIDKNSVNERMPGVPKGIYATVKISWEPKYETVILNFRFIVPRGRTRDTYGSKIWETFLSFDQF